MFVVGLIVEGEKVEGIIVVEKFVAELTHIFPFTEIVPLGHGVQLKHRLHFFRQLQKRACQALPFHPLSLFPLLLFFLPI